MSVKLTVRVESEAVTGQPITIPFEFTNRESFPPEFSISDESKRKKFPTSIVVSPITVRTWFKLKPLLLLIEESDVEQLRNKQGSVFDESTIAIMDKYDDILFEIVCIGIHNKRGDMPKWFKEVLKDNCNWHDIYILLNAILFRLQFNSFSNTITLCKEVSPLGEAEIIALQKNKESWSLKVASCLSQSVTSH